MLLTMQDASRLLSLSEKKLLKHVKNGDLVASHIDNCYSFNRTELIEWALKSGIKLSEQQVQERSSKFSKDGFSLAEALKRGGVYRNVAGTDQESLLCSIIELLPLSGNVDRASMIELVKTHDAMGMTAIGNGIAVPNVRSPIISRGHDIVVALFFLETPLSLFPNDKIPVEFVFEILSPSARVHLEVLAVLSQTLNQMEFVGMLKDGTADEEIFRYLTLREIN